MQLELQGLDERGRKHQKVPLSSQLQAIIDSLGSEVLSDSELDSLLVQSNRLHAVLQSRRTHRAMGSPHGVIALRSMNQLCMITDFLDGIADVPCALLVCKALNRAIRVGRQRSSKLMSRQGLRFLIESYSPLDRSKFISSNGIFDWTIGLGLSTDRIACSIFALSGRFDLARMARARGCPWGTNFAIWTAAAGHLEMLQWAVANDCPYSPAEVCEWAASSNDEDSDDCVGKISVSQRLERSLAILRWALADGVRCAEVSAAPHSGAEVGGILERATASGNVQAIKFLHSHGGWINFDVDKMWNNALRAPQEVKFETVRCLREFGLPWDAQACAAAAGPAPPVFHAGEVGFPRGIKLGGDLEALQYLRTHGCPWDSRTIAAAARAGNLDILRFAREGGCEWDSSTISGALSVLGSRYEHDGHRKVLRWALEQGCPLDAAAAATAAGLGDVEMLWLLMQHGCPLDEECCTSAARGGHLDCLKWLRKRACPWDEDTWALAADPSDGQLLYLDDAAEWEEGVKLFGSPQIHVLRYLAEAGCPREFEDASALLDKFLLCGWVLDSEE